MKHMRMTFILIAALIVSSCAAPQGANTPAEQVQPTRTLTTAPPRPGASAVPTEMVPQPSTTLPPPKATRTPQFVIHKDYSAAIEGSDLYPLAAAGPFLVGRRTFPARDSSRPGRQISITVWYPALLVGEDTTASVIPDAVPDPSGAPYPLLLSSTKVARIFAPTLVSHGFTWASIDGIDTYEPMNLELIQQPLDILFALDQVVTNPPEGLEGTIDAERSGAIGYSFDGYNALALSGARVDPQFYLGLCEDPIQTKQNSSFWFEGSYHCMPAVKWDLYIAAAGERAEVDPDALWQPFTDERIKAVMPMACEGWWLFGEKGLAAVEVPALFLAATNDFLYPENALIFEHLGSQDKTFISILNRDHMIVYDPEMLLRMRHFATAFFSYYLQGKTEYGQYFSQEFVDQLEGMQWGVLDDE